jgi:hypothetical protein
LVQGAAGGAYKKAAWPDPDGPYLSASARSMLEGGPDTDKTVSALPIPAEYEIAPKRDPTADHGDKFACANREADVAQCGSRSAAARLVIMPHVRKCQRISNGDRGSLPVRHFESLRT